MAGHDRGQNQGCTGDIAITGTPKFGIRARRYSNELNAPAVPVTRRGDAWLRVRHTTPNGLFVLTGDVRVEQYPHPDNIKGATGTITLQVHTSKTITLAVTFTSIKAEFDENRDDILKVTIVATVTAMPTLSGFGGTQATVSTTESEADNDVGAGKGIDPDGLQDNDWRDYSIVGYSAGTDAEETTRLTALISAAAASRAGMKIRRVEHTRVDKWSGNARVHFARTTTAEDIENQGSVTRDDEGDLADSATVTDVTTSSTPPSAPSSPVTGAKHTATESQELNDGHWRHTFHYGPRTSAEDVTMGGTQTSVDPQALTDSGTITEINDSSTAPATPAAPTGDCKHVGTTSQQIKDGKWRHTFRYGPRHSEDDIVFPGTVTNVDASALAGSATITQVTASGTPPATPAAPTGLVYRDVSTRQVKDSKWAHTFHYGESTRESDIEYEGSPTIEDAAALADRQEVTDVTNSGTAPATSVPAGYKHLETRTVQLTDDRWKHTHVYTRNDRGDDLTLDNTVTVDDPDDLGGEVREAFINSSSTPPATSVPSGHSHFQTTTRQLTTAGQYLHVHTYRRTSAAEELVHGQSSASAEVRLGKVTETASIVTLASYTPGTVAGVRDTEFTSRNNSATFDALSVKAINNAKALLRVREIANDVLLSGSPRASGLILTDARLNGSSVQVFLKDKVTIGTNRYWIDVQPQMVHCVREVFRVRRRKSQSPLPLYRDRIGTKNSSDFLGFETGTVTYLGALYEANMSLSPPPAWIEYLFFYDSLGQFTRDGISLGPLYTDADLTGVTKGTWVNAASLGWGDAAALPNANYSVFTA